MYGQTLTLVRVLFFGVGYTWRRDNGEDATIQGKGIGIGRFTCSGVTGISTA